tara:strand:+ start:119 stop:295 length:177 start_codon:yes stop_codon:yes gene_type:complete
MAQKVSVDSKERAKLKDFLEKASVNHLQRKLNKVSENSALRESLGNSPKTNQKVSVLY